jgi:molecular chaperone GrpE
MSSEKLNEEMQEEIKADVSEAAAEGETSEQDAPMDTEQHTTPTGGESAISSEEKNEHDDLIQQLEKELADTKDSLLRKAAELENVRKRVQRERVQLFTDARIDALKEFLPISEDLKRSLDMADTAEVQDSFLEGVKLVASKFEDVLAKYGVERIDETGIPFDVNLHDALLRQPAGDDKIKSDTVLQVLESGYKIGDKVIRHAKVIVSE